MNRKSALAGLAIVACAFGHAADSLTLAVRGAASRRTIMLPANASESQRYAAAELRAYVKRLTGVDLSVSDDTAALPPEAILLGETRHTAGVLGGAPDLGALGEDGFRLVAKPPHLVILGSSVRGCLYGVYELLERHGGCRWYASWHTVVPECAALSVPAALDRTQVPDFAMRSSYWFDVITHNDFAARQRVNTRPWGRMEPKYGGDAFRFCEALPSCHTFETLLPPSVYQKDHPDYYSKAGKLVQPCLTHPDVLAIVTSNVLGHIRRDPSARAYGVSQNDWMGYCECPRCAAIDREEGSHAGTMVRFVNAVAEAVAREHPDKIIETLAYLYTRHPPTKTRLRENVVPCLCPIECDFARPLPVSDYAENKSFCADVRGWSPMTDQLYVWDYACNFRHYPAPFPNAYALQGNLKFFRENKAREMFVQGAFQGNLADFAELKSWLLSKWMWNADLPMKELLDDFFPGYYGKGAPYVRDYFERLHRHQAERSRSGRHPLTIYELVTDSAFDDAFWEEAAASFGKAKAAVAGEASVYGRNVRGTAFSVDYVRFLRLVGKTGCLLWLSRDEPTAEGPLKAKRLAQAMLPVLEEFAPVRLSEITEHDERELRLIREAAASTVSPPPRVSRGFVEEKDLHYCHESDMGGFRDDPLAGDGRALWLANTHCEWSTEMPLSAIRYDPDRKLRLRVRCRVERQAGRAGEAFWAGLYDRKRNADVLGLSVKVQDVATDGYAWYDLGVFRPADTQIFWIGPGHFGEDGKSNIRGLWVDRIELGVVDD